MGHNLTRDLIQYDKELSRYDSEVAFRDRIREETAEINNLMRDLREDNLLKARLRAQYIIELINERLP